MTDNKNDIWLTHFEKSGKISSPLYNETIEYFSQFEKHTPYAKMKTFGYSAQGRELKVLVVAKDNDFTPKKAKRNGKAVLLIQNGIHSGEIEGKDAWMLLLREILITKEKLGLLENLVLLIIPILNIDGHERTSEYNRPNQNGPVNMGWRTTSTNLNMNRDYLKADTYEMKSLLKLFSQWLPDFVIDNHTTNGADYQYHITYGMEKHQNIYSGLGKWGKEKLMPFVLNSVEGDGFLTAPYVETKTGNLYDGIIDLAAPLRFSTGYSAAQNRLCLLVETHSLKPFENRVFSTKSMNTAVLHYLNQNFKELKEINKKADSEVIHDHLIKKKTFPLIIEGTDEFDTMLFKGFRSYEEASEITGNNVIRYTNESIEFEIPVYNKVKITAKVSVPQAYLIPSQFTNIVRILKLHGVKVHTLKDEKEISIQKYKFVEQTFAPRPYEGRLMVKVKTEPFSEKLKVEKGTFLVFTKQRTLKVILNLLEPEAPDSFVSWGFFNAFFERKEYAEAYVFEPIAKRMLNKSAKLKKEFFELLGKDESFRNDPGTRLDFFYTRSNYFDKGEKIYPIFRCNDKIILQK
ncbi:MAG: M14 family metallopeptidase [Ignavibacteria bacterium]|nr:M14 family metallopeptidase [Ignavibacteria bacterium]